MSPELQDQVREYFSQKGIAEDRVARVDMILALLSINSPEALDSAEELTGKPIIRCPPTVPLWPPKPVSNAPSQGRILKVVNNPFRASKENFSRYRRIRVGMTRGDASSCGITRQDLYRWTRAGYIEWSSL